MADQQMALARKTMTGPGRGSSSNMNKPTRQVVPQFLQKLYEMLNDDDPKRIPQTSELIRWSDTGDSFFVLDHERFAREVLGSWFKHQNFSSFVRQLNMYGFHKIPHLQQGVLKPEAETEFWNFEHPNFHRGQPDLLCLIQRKKQTAQGDENQIDLGLQPGGLGVGGSGSGGAGGRIGSPVTGPLSAGQILDINSIVSGIAAIKRHQTAISTDLNELRTSNQHLWQEAMAARERHKKHQDTINRILKFLAGVFGHSEAATGVRKEDMDLGRGHDNPARGAVVPRIPQRLLIGNGNGREGKGGAGGTSIAELEDEEPPYLDRAQSPQASNRFASVETPLNTAPPSTVKPAEVFSPAPTDSSRFASIPPVPTPTSAPTTNDTTHSLYQNMNMAEQMSYDPQQTQQQQQQQQQQQLTTTNGGRSGSQSPDAVLQAALAQVLQSPAQMQRLLSALASQSINPMPEPPPLQQYDPQQQQQQRFQQQQAMYQQLQPYDPPIDYSRGFLPDVYGATTATTDAMNAMDTTSNSLAAAPRADEIAAYENIVENDTRLQKTYRDTAEIEQDVNALHTSINSLIESLGIDPSDMHQQQVQDVQGQPQSQSQSINPHDTVLSNVMPPPPEGGAPEPEFDFETFFTDLALAQSHDGTTDYAQFADKLDASSAHIHDPAREQQLTAFLDEVNSPSDGTASPVATTYTRHEHELEHESSPEVFSQPKRGSKRKSDMAELSSNSIADDGGRRNPRQQAQQVSSNGTKSKRKR